MKGKKNDTEFVSQFVEECLQQGIFLSEEMAKKAEHEITNIDEKIMQVENLKIRRSKLLDVISTFKTSVPKNNDKKILCFYQIKYPNICKTICDSLRSFPAKKQDFLIHSSHELNFCLKQLLENNIIARVGDHFVRGDSFDEYMKLTFGE